MTNGASIERARTEAVHLQVQRPFVQSNSPAYIEALPHCVDLAYFGEDETFIQFPGDLTAGHWPRSWGRVGLMAIPKDTFQEVQEAALADNPALRPAVTYPSRGTGVFVKALPEGLSFAEDPFLLNTLVVGGRLKPSIFGSRFRPVLWAPGHHFVHLPEVTIHREGVRDIDGLDRRFPGEKVFV